MTTLRQAVQDYLDLRRSLRFKLTGVGPVLEDFVGFLAQHLLDKHAAAAARVCPSLRGKRVTVHLLRHTMALDLLQAGVDRAVIALWLGMKAWRPRKCISKRPSR